jgi:hypothetical protein
MFAGYDCAKLGPTTSKEICTMELSVVINTLLFLSLIGILGAFGGMISALLKIPTNVKDRKEYAEEYKQRYVLPCPLNRERDKNLGFFGDVFIG